LPFIGNDSYLLGFNKPDLIVYAGKINYSVGQSSSLISYCLFLLLVLYSERAETPNSPNYGHKGENIRISAKDQQKNCLLKSSLLLGLCPCFARLCPFSFFFNRRLFIEISRLDFFEQTFSLNFALQKFNSFFYIIADYSYLYDSLSPVSSIA
jgi:hypothetical protein